MKSRKNPYGSKLKKAVTMRLSEDVIGYFKGVAHHLKTLGGSELQPFV